MIGEYFQVQPDRGYRAAVAHSSQSIPGIFGTLVTSSTLDS
jgi:hypothetical protein